MEQVSFGREAKATGRTLHAYPPIRLGHPPRLSACLKWRGEANGLCPWLAALTMFTWPQKLVGVPNFGLQRLPLYFLLQSAHLPHMTAECCALLPEHFGPHDP
jgi:hypothetical protein